MFVRIVEENGHVMKLRMTMMITTSCVALSVARNLVYPDSSGINDYACDACGCRWDGDDDDYDEDYDDDDED